ncbi:YhcN/YlaJ family sporulation lipoprotein [Lentibacillus cibarius]|uniref:Sporulation protein n=1 Tax=Lentibacillus cibarius TaxID=2583219 RepID=A0A5S3QGY0_9BACI|nr:YhcN/YlaJ family sporulation lipoprotein [Lentibacillus cibarius]TMN21067.1 hypothetical protein FFL34_02310 [Lentibacillus cibarius]
MRITKWMVGIVAFFFLIGCAANDNNQESSGENGNTQPINYETEKERQDRQGVEKKNIGERGGYPQNEQKRLNDGDETGKSDKFTNETSISIANHLKKNKKVKQAQVTVTDERIVVGVLINDSAPPDMRERLEQEVQDMVPNKEAYVYTDDIFWDRMRNKDARLDQLNGDTEEFLREFFNRDREDW